MSNDNQTTPGAITFTTEQIDGMTSSELMDVMMAMTAIPCGHLNSTELNGAALIIRRIVDTFTMSTEARGLLEQSATRLDARAAVREAAEG
jgi:hypothetical protein